MNPDLERLQPYPFERLAKLIEPYTGDTPPVSKRLAKQHPEKLIVMQRVAVDLAARLRVMLDLDRIRPQLEASLAEDVGPGDVTSELLVGEGARGRGRIRAKAPGVLAGVQVAAEVLRLQGAEIEEAHNDGTEVAPGDEVLVFSGPARGLLAAERTALNYLCHLSGIATLTAKFVAAAGNAAVLDTRKTLPGLRYLQKYAVTCGGGQNHRYALYDADVNDEFVPAASGNELSFGLAGNAGNAGLGTPVGSAGDPGQANVRNW